MTDSRDDAEIELRCESCGRKIKKTIEWIKGHEEARMRLRDHDTRRRKHVPQGGSRRPSPGSTASRA